jgi:cytochrome o ubiquinol oxidase operon protein cyoD
MGLLVLLCVAQLLAQLVFFLHLGSAPDQRANTGIFVCTALLIAIIVAGSLWVTHNANANMMPTHMTVERARTKG